MVNVQWFGSEAQGLTDKTADRKVANQLLYRDSEPMLDIVEQGLPWSLDGDCALFRLLSDAQRIRLAHLFDPALAVHASVVEPLQHQITAVYQSMLQRQSLRFLLADDPGAGKMIDQRQTAPRWGPGRSLRRAGNPWPASGFGPSFGYKVGSRSLFIAGEILMRARIASHLLATLGLLTLCLAATFAQAAPARNVLLFISDGASWGTWDMASYYQYGRKGMQAYDRFPVKLGMTTYPLNTSTTPTHNAVPTVSYDPASAWDKTPNAGNYGGFPSHFNGYDYIKRDHTDSAAAGTALATGVKTYNNAIGVDNFAQDLAYITQCAKAQGKATGIVSSVPFSHATPAAFAATNRNRNNYGEISQEMIDNPAVDLIMGGGHPDYDSNGRLRAVPVFAKETGSGGGYLSRTAWNTVNDRAKWQLVQTRSDFEALAKGALALTGRKIIGLPQVHDTLQYRRDGAVVGRGAPTPSGKAYIDTVPSLETMTRGALNILSKGRDGFFLMVEGGAVDWAAHARDTAGIIEEQIDFNRAVQAAVDWVQAHSSWDETLLIVLTDHGNGMPMGPHSDSVAFEPIRNNGAGNLPGVKWHYHTHTNENTLLWAKGAGADRFYDEVDGVDPGLAQVLGFNDGRYITNTDVATVLQAVIVAEPATCAR